LIRYWLTREADERFDEKVNDINTLYKQAPELAKKGEAVISKDEMTGVQALERKHPGLPMAPGKVDSLVGDIQMPGCLVTNVEDDLPFPHKLAWHARTLIGNDRDVGRKTIVTAPFVNGAYQIGLGRWQFHVHYRNKSIEQG